MNQSPQARNAFHIPSGSVIARQLQSHRSYARSSPKPSQHIVIFTKADALRNYKIKVGTL